MERKESQKELNSKKSELSGLGGFLENILRQFNVIGHLLCLFPIAISYIVCLTISAAPAFFIYDLIVGFASDSYLLKGLGFTSFALIFCFCLLFAVPLVNIPWRFLMQEYRGPWMSLGAYPWYVHNALVYLVRYTFLDFITPSPLNILFYRMMGMKIGKGCMINTSNISDPCMIEIGDYVTLGGSSFLMAHYGMKGFLIIEKLKIGSKSNIGLNAKILGSVQIGEAVTIAPNATVYPKTNLPDGSKFGVE